MKKQISKLIGREKEDIFCLFENILSQSTENTILFFKKSGIIECTFKDNKCIEAFKYNHDLKVVLDCLRKSDETNYTFYPLIGLGIKEIREIYPETYLNKEGILEITVSEGVICCEMRDNKCINARLFPNNEQLLFSNEKKKRKKEDILN